MRSLFVSLIALLLPLVSFGQETAIDSLTVYHATTARHSGLIPQEMIYLHLDNNSYYRGDRIYFACYLVTSGKLKPSSHSRTVYVELLNPGGKIIDRCVLNAVDGRCSGSLLANETPFYSGYYEIRAYTRYMLNFGPEAIYSRVVPIFAAPKTEGDWAERTILNQQFKNVPMLRPAKLKAEKVDMKFYPEGGHLVGGLPARVAFELTASGRPLVEAQGRILDRAGNEVATFSSGHMGRGTVEFTPAAADRYVAELTVDGKQYRRDLPAVEPEGIALAVDALQNPNGIEVTLSRTPGCPTQTVGVSLTCRGELYGRTIVDLSEEPSATFSMSTLKMPSGVAQLTIFNAAGQPVADRLFFHNRGDYIDVDYSFNKAQYQPFEPVDLSVKLADAKTGAAVTTPFSISVTDADNHAAYGSNIMADLLLASEIRGYLHNPAYYFEPGHEADLDNLLMVQGWRRYSWSELAGMEPVRLDSMPEQAIEVRGRILERYRNKPKANISVSAMLSRTDTTGVMKTYTFTTDADGRFTFRDSLAGNWLTIISSSNKDKVSSNRIFLDLSEHPAPRRYELGESEVVIDSVIIAPGADLVVADSAASNLVIPGMKTLNEVEVTAEYTASQEMAGYMETSFAAYDIMKEVNSLRDKGKRRLRTLNDVLPQIDGKFYVDKNDSLCYDGKLALIFADPDFGSNKAVLDEIMGVDDVMTTSDGDLSMHSPYLGKIPADYVKNVFINNRADAMVACAARMADRTGKSRFDTLKDASKTYGCVVFIEFYPDRRSTVQNGVRRDIIEGYTVPAVEFYSPDYSTVPPVEPDYRRTLYWNPDLRPDATGSARIRFYNNSTARTFNVDATALTPSGRLTK